MLVRPLLPVALYHPCLGCRTYAISLKPPKAYDKRTSNRVYPERKRFLYDMYIRILESSSKTPLLFLQHSKFTAPRLHKLRRDIAVAASPQGSYAPSLLHAGPTIFSQNNDPNTYIPPSLTVIRTSIFGVALRDFAPMDAQLSGEIAETVQGSLAILSLPSLDPPKLNAIIRAIQRSVPAPQSTPQDKTDKKVEDDDFVPGRRVKRVKPIQTPELSLMGALIDGRVFKVPQVQDVAKLPTLDILHAQLIGLLSSPAAQLAAVLSQASGGQLARTLQGFQKGLEDAEKTDAGQST